MADNNIPTEISLKNQANFLRALESLVDEAEEVKDKYCKSILHLGIPIMVSPYMNKDNVAILVSQETWSRIKSIKDRGQSTGKEGK